MKNIRRYFITGLLVTLPAFFTIYLLFVIVKFIDGIFGKPVNVFLKHEFGFAVPGVGFILGLIFVMGVGVIATNLLVRNIFRPIERWFLKLPFVKQVYPSAKQIVDSFISKEKSAFKKVVLVQYPSKGIWSIGFMTNEAFLEAKEGSGEDLLSILIATTPSPFTGFVIFVPRKEVKILDMTIEEGIKVVVSGGIVNPESCK